MKPIRVNADYESVLFENKESLLVNQALEFLAFFIEDRPIFTNKKYTDTYLKYVEEVTGHQPQIVSEGHYENWWGPLKDLAKERKLNSKELSASLFRDSLVIENLEKIKISSDKFYLAKSPFGMSGKNIMSFKKGEEHFLTNLLNKSKKLIIEPLYEREKDFSHYYFPTGEVICYENIVDKHFQYKGTIFNNVSFPDTKHLSFFHDVNEHEWIRFEKELEQIIQFYRSHGAKDGFSIDSFTFLENGERKIRSLSEVNCRKTMGLIAWELSQRFSVAGFWFMFIFVSFKQKKSFSIIQESILPVKWDSKTKSGCLQLSPGDTRFEIFCLSSESEKKGKILLEELKKLLPDGQFSI